jgi:hypothetical protein
MVFSEILMSKMFIRNPSFDVLTHMLGKGKAHVATVAASYQTKFPNIKLAFMKASAALFPSASTARR